MNKPSIQASEAPPIMLGGDVVALYPSMKTAPTGAVAYEAMKKTKIKFEKINYKYAIVFLLLTIGAGTLNNLGLSGVIPERKKREEYDKLDCGDGNVEEETSFKNMPLQNGNPRSLSAKMNRDMEAWDFKMCKLSDAQKSEILARIVQVAVLVLMSTHAYSFAGKLYKQKLGAPIGLRASACLAKILMVEWDCLWARIQNSMGLVVHLMYRYVDDIRVLLRPINMGWTWSSVGWTWTGEELNQNNVIEHSKEQIKQTFESVFDFLKYTTESEDDYSDEMLPTLDFKTAMQSDGSIAFQYYHKDMENNRVLDRQTAL